MISIDFSYGTDSAEIFRQIGRRAFIHRSSKELFITQSTLSLSIKQLEEELGVTLFDRIGKKIYLTDAGRDFLDCSRKAIEEVAYGIQAFEGNAACL